MKLSCVVGKETSRKYCIQQLVIPAVGNKVVVCDVTGMTYQLLRNETKLM